MFENYWPLIAVVGVMILAISPLSFADNVARRAEVTATGTRGSSDPGLAVDGKINDSSRWLGEGVGCSLTISFDSEKTITAADIYSGYQQANPVQTLRFQRRRANGWVDIPGGRIVDNDQIAIRVVFNKPVKTDAVRVVFDKPGPQDVARVLEVRVWDGDPEQLDSLVRIEKTNYNPVFDMSQHQIFLNQSGFNTQWAKRFTAPLSPDGTTFTITPESDNRLLYTGTIQNHIGDFTDFEPDDPGLQYVVHVDGGGLEPNTSDAFYVQPFLFQRVALEPALRMFVDDRSATGSWPGAFGCAPWRDSPFYAYSSPSLVNLYLSNPSFFDALNVEMDFEQDMQRVLAPDFVLDRGAEENAMEILGRIYNEIDPPVGDRVPDIIQLIHWGVSWWYIDPISKDWAGTEEKLHPETIAIPAFFLYGYPHYQQYFTDRFYTTIRDYTFDQWDRVGLFDVQTHIGTFKGRYPPGWSVLPNLMMYEVAKREGRDDAQRFLDAAAAQVQWIIEEVDLEDPLNTKGQRMSEHKTISGLYTMLTEYPESAPQGLRDFLRTWADVAISRSDNLWDFRKYNDEHWSLPRQMPGMTGGGSSWNEPGNLAGFPYLAWKVAAVLGDAPGDATRIERLNVLAVSHFDNLWGRNPLGKHTGWRGHLDFLGVERGWPIKYRPVCAHLYTARGAICSSAATEHYPFNPSGGFRHPEGWTAFNAALNMGLVAATNRDTKFAALDPQGQPIETIGSDFRLSLSAPVFTRRATVTLTASSGDRETVTLTAKDYLMFDFSGQIRVQAGEATPEDGVLQIQPGDRITARYGHGYFANSMEWGAE